jgi:hypothetical protein
MSSTSIVKGDVMRCGRANCQGTRDTGVHRCLVDSPIRQAKAELVRLLRKEAGVIKVCGRGRVRGLLKTTWQPTRGGWDGGSAPPN